MLVTVAIKVFIFSVILNMMFRPVYDSSSACSECSQRTDKKIAAIEGNDPCTYQGNYVQYQAVMSLYGPVLIGSTILNKMPCCSLNPSLCSLVGLNIQPDEGRELSST